MSKEVMGVSLDRLEDPIRTALGSYQESSDGLVFDSDYASKLEPTPTKPNSARSETDATFRGEPIGKLFVIAFKPGDGSGSEVNYQLDNLDIDPAYPKSIHVVPRNKTGVHSEAHLAIARQKIEDAHAEPKLYGGTFDLLGLEGNKVRKIGELGHPENQEILTPVTTLTVAYRGLERFGDPHAVYSGVPDSIQVCAFLAISEDVHKAYSQILDSLNPQLPIKA